MTRAALYLFISRPPLEPRPDIGLRSNSISIVLHSILSVTTLYSRSSILEGAPLDKVHYRPYAKSIPRDRRDIRELHGTPHLPGADPSIRRSPAQIRGPKNCQKEPQANHFARSNASQPAQTRLLIIIHPWLRVKGPWQEPILRDPKTTVAYGGVSSLGLGNRFLGSERVTAGR
jgi:hypothetical protein